MTTTTTITRRRVLLGGGAAAAGAGLWAASGIPRAAADAAIAPKKMVLVVASGGWDPVFALDPKPGTSIAVPGGTLEEHEGIPIWADPTRAAVSELFAAHAGICTLVNGVQVQSLVHSDCSKRLLTGTSSDINPDIGAIVAYELGRDLPAPYLVLGQTSYAGPYASISARAGTANQIGTLLDPLRAFADSSGSFVPRFSPDAAEADLIRAYVDARAERERAVRGQVGHNQRRLADFAESHGRADALAQIADFGDFDYTRDLGVQAQIGLDALEQGLSQVVHMEMGDWDSHDGNLLRQTERHQTFFAGLKALLDELAARPGAASGSRLIDETVVVVVSEMGRTPMLNEQGGKDHWPVTSALVFGGGVAGGRVLGATDDMLQGRTVDLATGEPDDGGTALQYGNFAAGILALAGVDPEPYLPNSEPFHALCG